ncbi:PREDICTED: putative pectinesterase 10 [Camelina sativa]|uniref:pectinesterase n=1 Tax=Camelina sativa TaxID=90675 RepID=A0ABM0X3Z9_CAMSA|nr:PREDICTED: putative pectinesterase 10 [Camelina sativa]
MKSLESILALSFLYFTVSSLLVSSYGLDPKFFNKEIIKTVVVSHNGKGHFRTIQEAVDSVPSGNKQWIRIYLRHGTYNEKVVIPKEKQKIIMQGNNAAKVVIQYNDAGQSNSSGSFIVHAQYFVAIQITFKNTNIKITPIIPYPAIKVAPAIKLTADKAWLYGCSFISVQDTVNDFQGRHYFKNCYIEGAIDFIWGQGQSIYQNCVIHVRGITKAIGKEDGMLPGYITAQGRESEKDTSGFVFRNCKIQGDGEAYLGRAWRAYSRVIFYGTDMSNVIVPQGWDAWYFKQEEGKLTYAEVNCTGEGADKKGRVGWEKNLSDKDVESLIDFKTFIDEDGWMATLPSSLGSFI